MCSRYQNRHHHVLFKSTQYHCVLLKSTNYHFNIFGYWNFILILTFNKVCPLQLPFLLSNSFGDNNQFHRTASIPFGTLTLLHLEGPKLYINLAFLSANGLKAQLNATVQQNSLCSMIHEKHAMPDVHQCIISWIQLFKALLDLRAR